MILVGSDVEDESIELRRWNSNNTVWKLCLTSLWSYARERKFSKFLPQCGSLATGPFDAAPDLGLAREEDSMKAAETQTKEQCSHCCRQLTEKERSKITKRDALKAHGII